MKFILLLIQNEELKIRMLFIFNYYIFKNIFFTIFSIMYFIFFYINKTQQLTGIIKEHKFYEYLIITQSIKINYYLIQIINLKYLKYYQKIILIIIKLIYQI